jgi:Ca2+/Na+ antiporter
LCKYQLKHVFKSFEPLHNLIATRQTHTCASSCCTAAPHRALLLLLLMIMMMMLLLMLMLVLMMLVPMMLMLMLLLMLLLWLMAIRCALGGSERTSLYYGTDSFENKKSSNRGS